MLFSALAAFVIGIAPYRDQGETAPLDRASHSVLTIHVLIGLGLFAGGTQLENIGWLNSVLSLVLVYAAAGLVAASMRGALALAGALIVGALWVWPGFPLAPGSTVTHLPAGAWRSLAEAGLFLSFAALAPLSLASVCTRQLFKGPALTRAGLWIMAGTATLTPLAALTSAYLRAGAAISGMGFAAVAAALACLFVAAATAARADIDKPLEAAGRNARLFILGAAASASLAALALAFTFALEGGTLTVALALSALGAAFVSVRLDIPALRWCVAALGLTVAARLAWDPRIVGDALGTTPVFNWLLFGYGVPALAFGFAARLMRRGGPEDTPVRIAEALGVLLAGFLVFFEIRHAMNGGDIYARRHSMVEQGLHALSAFGFAAVLTRLDHARANRVFHMASLAFAVISFAITVVGLGITANPLLTHEAVGGGALVNSLLLGYALPAIAALILARTAQGLRPRWYVSGARIAAIALTFAFLSLEVRRFWLGEKINVLLGMGQSELYSYSAVWLAFGGLLLVYGLWRSSREVRLASAGFVVLTVLKVFLIDLSSLEGLLRAVSFIALGLALIAIGLAYQRFVFGGGRKDPQGVRAPGDMV